MTSMPPPGSTGGDGRWSYSAAKGAPAPERAARPDPAASPRLDPLSNLEPLSQQLLKVAAGLSVLLILVVAVAWLHGSSEASLNPIAEAAVHTQRQPGSRIAVSGVYTLPTGQQSAMRGQGVYNARTGRSREVMEIDVPGASASIRMYGVGDEQTVYMRSKVLSAGLPPGYRWLAVQSGLGSSAETSVTSSADSEGELEMLRSATGDVEDLGEEEVRGVTTTRYRGEVDLHSLADRLDAEGKAIAAHEYEQLAKSMPDTIPVEAWIDEHGLVRRTRMVTDVPLPTGTAPVKMDLTMEFFDFGITPKISLPKTGEAFDATPLGRAELHLLDGSAMGISARVGKGTPLSAAAFNARADAICSAPDAAQARLKEASQQRNHRVKEVIALVKAGSASPRTMVRVLDNYGESYLEPMIRLGVRTFNRLARLSPPPDRRAAVQRFLRVGSVALEGDLAFTRALEVGSLEDAKGLEAEVQTSLKRLKSAANVAHLEACDTNSEDGA